MYLDQTGMIQRFGETALISLTDRADPPTGAIDPTVLDQALSDAEATIHGYARTAGYMIPFSPGVPDQVLRWEATLAYYYLHTQALDVADRVAEDYKAAMAELRDLAAGRLKLETAGAEDPDAEDHLTVVADTAQRHFTSKSLRVF